MCSNTAGEGDVSFDEEEQNSPVASDNTSEYKARHYPRQLTAVRALEIFRLRPQLKGPLRRGSMVHCKAIAPGFGVSAKTVREIWAGRAWARATRHEWTEAEFATRASSFSLQRTTSNNAVGDLSPHSWSISALQHLPAGALGASAPWSQHEAPTPQVAPLLGLNTGAVPSLQALLAAAHAPQQAVLQQTQPAAPQAHTIPAAQLPTQFAGFQTAPPHTVWGSGAPSGAATQLVPAQDFESAIRSLQAKLAHLQAENQAQNRFLQDEVHHFLQQHQTQKQHAIAELVAEMGGVQRQQSFVGAPDLAEWHPLYRGTSLTINRHPP